MRFVDLIKLPTHIQPTGPGGRGQGHGRGRGKLPNQLLTSTETVNYVQEAHEQCEKKENLKKEKETFMKEAVADKKGNEKKKDLEVNCNIMFRCFFAMGTLTFWYGDKGSPY